VQLTVHYKEGLILTGRKNSLTLSFSDRADLMYWPREQIYSVRRKGRITVQLERAGAAMAQRKADNCIYSP
jgi:hypothetical protein